MSVPIVVSLEVIEIDQHHRDRKPIARGLLPQAARLLFERVAAERANEFRAEQHEQLMGGDVRR